MFAGSGRMGSAANTTALAQNSANMRLNGLEQDYNRAFSSMLESQKFLNQAQNQAINNQITPVQNMIAGAPKNVTKTVHQEKSFIDAVSGLLPWR